MSALDDLIKESIEELREWCKENPDLMDWEDQIHEIADSQVPVYNGDRMACAADPEIWNRQSEMVDGWGRLRPGDLVDHVGILIYEVLEENLCLEMEEIKQEMADAEEEDDE